MLAHGALTGTNDVGWIAHVAQVPRLEMRVPGPLQRPSRSTSQYTLSIYEVGAPAIHIGHLGCCALAAAVGGWVWLKPMGGLVCGGVVAGLSWEQPGTSME